MKPIDYIKENIAFISGCTPYDFTQYMGQYALEVRLTNGNMEMFTTPINPELGNDKGDFVNVEEFKDCVKYCMNNNLIKND